MIPVRNAQPRPPQTLNPKPQTLNPETQALTPMQGSQPGPAFSLSAPTVAHNAVRVLRALQLRKAVLLEGSPGVGKTSLVGAIARASGAPLPMS